MASQRVLLFTIGGTLAENAWKDICRWSDARTIAADDEWSSDDWPSGTKLEIDAFVEKIKTSGYTPPILYRSEHMDCWSMGDVYETALVKKHRDYSRRLFTAAHQIIATWVRFSEQIIADRDTPDETRWLYDRVNEAVGAWSGFAETRLVVLVRSVVGESWTDEDVSKALMILPTWWTNAEPPHTPESPAPSVTNGTSSPPTR